MSPEEYFGHLRKYRLEPSDTDSAKMDGYFPFLERLDLVDNSSVVLFDFSLLGYTFLIRRFKFLLGFSPEDVLGVGIQFFFRI